MKILWCSDIKYYTNMTKAILGFTGRIACGKDVSKNYVEKKYGASSHRYSTMLRDILKRLYLPITRENLQNLSTDLRARFGEDTMANVIAEDVKNDKHKIIIIEGIRRMADIINIQQLPGFYLIGINTTPQNRYERMIKRNENVGEQNQTFADFLKSDQMETEIQISDVMEHAKFQLDNNGSLEDLYGQIDKIINKIKQ